LALLSTRLDRALVLQVNEKTFGTIPKESFHFGADRTTASSDSGVELQKTGQFTRIDGPVYSLAVGSHPVLIRPHPGAVGELTLEQLWEFVPVWRAEADNYVPNAAAVRELKAVDRVTKLTLIFGTWCGDSKFHVPRLLRALRDARN